MYVYSCPQHTHIYSYIYVYMRLVAMLCKNRLIFKPGSCWPKHTWFHEIAFVREVRMRVCMRVCVCPQAINNYSREMKPE